MDAFCRGIKKPNKILKQLGIEIAKQGNQLNRKYNKLLIKNYFLLLSWIKTKYLDNKISNNF